MTAPIDATDNERMSAGIDSVVETELQPGRQHWSRLPGATSLGRGDGGYFSWRYSVLDSRFGIG